MAKKVGGLKGFLSRSYTSGSKGKDLLDLLWRERATVTKAFAVAEAPTRSLGRGASSDVCRGFLLESLQLQRAVFTRARRI